MVVPQNGGNSSFIKGVTWTLGIAVVILTAWSIYTQSNRFTIHDGTRLISKIERMEKRLDFYGHGLSDKIERMEKRLDAIEIQSARQHPNSERMRISP